MYSEGTRELLFGVLRDLAVQNATPSMFGFSSINELGCFIMDSVEALPEITRQSMLHDYREDSRHPIEKVMLLVIALREYATAAP